MAKALLLVDPQNDFISGSLPVPGAAAAMDALGAYLADADFYALKIVTLDFHTWDHCSFLPRGGQWPRHCVAHSSGAAIYEPLLAPLYKTPGSVVILTKGVERDRDAYSAFQDHGQELAELFRSYHIIAVDICGLAGDVCVLQTLKDGLSSLPGAHWHVLAAYAPSLDGGKALEQFCQGEAACSRS